MLLWPLLLILHSSWVKLIRRRWIKICSPSQRATWTPNFNRSVSDTLCESEECGTSLEEPQWSTESLFNKSKIDLFFFFFFNSDPPLSKTKPCDSPLPNLLLPDHDGRLLHKMGTSRHFSGLLFCWRCILSATSESSGGEYLALQKWPKGDGSNLGRGWWEVIHVGKEEAGSCTRAPNDTTDAHLLLFSPVSSKNTLISGYAKSFF